MQERRSRKTSAIVQLKKIIHMLVHFNTPLLIFIYDYSKALSILTF